MENRVYTLVLLHTTTSANIYLKMPLLHLRLLLDGHGPLRPRLQRQSLAQHSPRRRHILSRRDAPLRLPSRRRAARPLHLDAPAHHDRRLPRATLSDAAERDEAVHQPVRQDVPLLVVRGRFPVVDEGRE